MLISSGADVNLPVQDGFTSLHIGAQNGEHAVVDALLRAGAAVNMKDDANWTPLFFACQYGHLSVVSVLPIYTGNCIYNKCTRLVIWLSRDLCCR